MTSLVTAISARLEAKFAVELGAIDDIQLQRRCADITELLAVIEAGGAEIVALSPDFPGMSGAVISELVLRGASILAVTSATSTLDQRQCEAWGISSTYVLGDGDLASVLGALGEVSVDAPPDFSVPLTDAGEGDGSVICIWGPPGAPGRSTTALHLARQLGGDAPTLLIDADTYAPSISTMTGLMDDAPVLLSLARMVDVGVLNQNQLLQAAAPIENQLSVVTGIGSPSRWHELSPAAFASILETARKHYRWIVVDIASEFVLDESLIFDTLSPTRNGVSSWALAAADHVVALAACDTVGLGRFVGLWEDLRELDAQKHVVLNKARQASVGGAPHIVAAGALNRFAGVQVDVVLPDAREELDSQGLLGAFAKPLRFTAYERGIEELKCRITGEPVALCSTKHRRRPVRLKAS